MTVLFTQGSIYDVGARDLQETHHEPVTSVFPAITCPCYSSSTYSKVPIIRTVPRASSVVHSMYIQTSIRTDTYNRHFRVVGLEIQLIWSFCQQPYSFCGRVSAGFQRVPSMFSASRIDGPHSIYLIAEFRVFVLFLTEQT